MFGVLLMLSSRKNRTCSIYRVTAKGHRLLLGLLFSSGIAFLARRRRSLKGSFFDSLLGATVQAMYYCPDCDMETERPMHRCGTKAKTLRGISWINNDTVNFLATLFGGIVAMGMFIVRQKDMGRHV